MTAMQGIDSHAHMQQLTGRLDTIAAHAEAGTALYGSENPHEATEPALHYLAGQLMQRPRQRVRDLS
jgi:hypothetical protein